MANLNEKQYEAVTTIDGPLLVLAGAGSGKTTVLANRVAYILQNTFTNPWNVLAITFTNKAANEMKERITDIIGPAAKNMWIGTFHSVCVRLLRSCIERVGYGTDFVIYDSADARVLIKECERELDVPEKIFPPRSVMSVISSAKNDMMLPEEFSNVYSSDPRMRTISEIYNLYQKKLRSNNALDFDDIIMLTVKVLRENPDVAEKYQENFHYILVDEYQDTNNAQYGLIGILAQGHGNVCVVGDDDQSIYKFRGANVSNILEFPNDYVDAKVVKLEQNYRSTPNILNAANKVISNNNKRMTKALWTDREEGEPIVKYTGVTEADEASFIAERINKRYRETKQYSDCAILYRTNSQSRAIEDALMREAIPYKVLAGLRFYDRKEIKDIIAYLRVIYNVHDDLSLERIINEPKRKIGSATIDKLRKHASDADTSIFDIIEHIDLYEDLKTQSVRLKAFAALIRELRRLASEFSIEELVNDTLIMSGYKDMLLNDTTIEGKTRLENIDEFMNVVHEFAEDVTVEGTLGEFLERVTLVSDIDDYDQSQDYVVLMTVHSAKGLEFPVVFMTGMEEGLFPVTRAVSEQEDIEEERRLCYVAITRAREKLYITNATSRFRFGERNACIESRFLDEIPDELMDDLSPVRSKIRQSLEDFGFELKSKHREIYEPKKELPPAVDMSDFNVGDRVMHRKFGKGTVVSAQAFGRDAILVIDFDDVGAKRLMAAFAKLERIE